MFQNSLNNAKNPIIFHFFSIQLSFSQTFSGVVADTLNKPLENANVIAKPLQEKAEIKFSFADNRGRYKLELDKEVRYEIKVSYIGYQEDAFFYKNIFAGVIKLKFC